ncbi:phage major capsid protein, HK97 family [Sphingomonas laterariae]|uniref:Phage major capsid protein, HK97 family n=1 Tax=Edaphosphingomonas laterariae TaxID=861865 RepID=A0A239JJR8_9SPHN|nr:phage major capsid protein [Sphingomonas laterariae]SNT06121.1 phage major capsid protein, HK97 family [Sphingomonas laterariae]
MKKNMRALRATVAQHRNKMRVQDAALLEEIEDGIDAAKHPADLRRARNKITNYVRDKLSAPDADTEVADGYFALIDIIDLQIAAMTDGDHQLGSTRPPSGWVNAATGQPVQLLGPEDRVADHAVPSSARLNTSIDTSHMSVGEMVQAMLTGGGSKEVRAAMSEGENTAGGYSIPTVVLPQFIDRLRAATRFIQAGGRTLMLEDMRTRIVRIENDPTAGWRAENAGVVESAPTFGMVEFVPKSLAVLVKTSVELLQDSANARQMLEQALINALSLQLDQACFFGTGADNQPLGIVNTPGINAISMGANGATPANFDPFIDAMYETEVDNSPVTSAAVMHPRTMRTFRKLKDVNNNPLVMPADVASLRRLTTTSFPIDEAQGTGTNCSSILQGDFSHAILGMRQQLVIRLLDQPFAGNLQVGFLAHLRADVAVTQPPAFCKVTGVKP